MCGCGDTCFQFSSNPGTGNVKIVAGDAPCRFTKPLGTAQFRIGASFVSDTGVSHTGVSDTGDTGPGSASVPSPMVVRHIFVTLSGVEGHEDSTATMDSPGWQHFAPDLAEHPVQIDLLAPLDVSTAFPVDTSTGVPAGVYRQIRLQLSPSSIMTGPQGAEAGVATAKQNVCGSLHWNCAVLGDGTTRPLAIEEESSDARGNRAVRISVDQISGGAVTILPNATRTYEVRFEPHWFVTSSGSDAVRLIPVFFVSPQ